MGVKITILTNKDYYVYGKVSMENIMNEWKQFQTEIDDNKLLFNNLKQTKNPTKTNG